MKTLICILACFFSVTCFAQTKLIAHRSHSGNNATFRIAIENSMFDSDASNFGIWAAHVVNVDSVILKGSRIIILRRSYDVYGSPNSTPRNTKYTKDELTKANAAELLTATNIDSLKLKLRKLYASAKLDSTRFIGFDKKFKQKKG